ncbi:allantoinase [Phycomyces blakesleeanus]|uniref:allantoinase n=2 Tax=Phycomyces blakesleeanus TaxID=4837 RepID=A0A163EGC4_PHYB8|nr:hypothetical protein PHYBLDRAFT_163599 [Phycomyces blakesleeanus NRRL 1555(-)]OAD78490.1 hypothetical protein PHYBLDRAFT_163599 [Phycomyces blakesleeanus NRRL 1555(-)]|eukprot:XP_018296530.1 hypothetical protein PHYBLDRAFT_163599 [Phycomyces blakesleeanus NRRL 1555(-)]
MANTSECRWLLVKAQKAVLSPSHDISPASVLVDRTTGKVIEVTTGNKALVTQTDPTKTEVMVLSKDQVLIPGLLDAHVHLNEPGRTEWEGFATGTRAAAAGGISTVIDMPLNAIPPTTTPANFETKLAAASGQCHVDVGFWGGVVPDNAEELPNLISMGVRGFKCFLIESGVDEFPCVNEAQVRLAMDKLANTNSLFLFHAEMEAGVSYNVEGDERAYSSFLNSRPQVLETTAIDMIIRLTREYHQKNKPVNTHIVHLSAASAIPAIRAAKKEGLPLTVETCFHYLNFTSEAIEDGATHYKCCPPIREAVNRDALWDALLDGTIDYVVSDHSPCTAQLKKLDSGDFAQAWGGIASVQFGLPVLWSEGRKRGATIQNIVHWLSYAPAKLTQLSHRKGQVCVGHDADLAIWRPDAAFDIKIEDIQFKNKLSPYIGKHFQGTVDRTLVRGQVVFDRAAISSFPPPLGKVILE